MTSRLLVVLCAFLQVVSIIATSENALRNNFNSDGLLKVEENFGGRNEILLSSRVIKLLDDRKNEIEKKIEDSKDSADLKGTRKYQSEDSETPWFTKVPLLPIVYAKSSSLPDGLCKRQAKRYLRDLKNGTLWATQMFDASTKYPDGLISGQMSHLGDFDGCYNLKANLIHHDDDDFGIDEISGRYCLVDIEYEKQGLPAVNPNERHELIYDPNDSVWEAIREKGDRRRKKRYRLRMAMCVPEVCSYTDIEAALQEPLKSFGIEQNLNLNITVKPHLCQSRKDAPKFSKGAKIYCIIVGGLIALVIVSTIYDLNSKEKNEDNVSTTRDLMLCFSARRNFNTIMTTTTGHRGLQTIHLIRSIWLTLTMIGHRIMEYWAGPTINPNYIEFFYTYKTSMIVFGGPHIIEGFFGLGGLLVSYSLLGELDAKKKMNFLGLLFIRFLRLTPSYMLVVFFCALILPHTGTGPYWEWRTGVERDACSNWWPSLLYINNYVNPEKICLFQSWYLSVDYHLFAIALIVTYLFWRMPRLYGYLFLCAIIVGGCIIPFLDTYMHGVQPIYIGYLWLEDTRDDPYFTDHYIKTHERITSYFIGVLVGAVIYDHGKAPWYLNKITSNVLFILLVVGFSLGSQFLGHKYYDPNVKPTPLDAALYASLHKGMFAISTCAIPLLITIGTGLNFHYNSFTPAWCQPIARLSYGAYLVHTIIQLYDMAVTRTARSFAIHNMFWDYIPDIVFAFGVSLVLTLIIEGPFRRLEKRFIMKREKPLQSNGVKKEWKKIN